MSSPSPIWMHSQVNGGIADSERKSHHVGAVLNDQANSRRTVVGEGDPAYLVESIDAVMSMDDLGKFAEGGHGLALRS